MAFLTLLLAFKPSFPNEPFLMRSLAFCLFLREFLCQDGSFAVGGEAAQQHVGQQPECAHETLQWHEPANVPKVVNCTGLRGPLSKTRDEPNLMYKVKQNQK